jgi:hypothetical protein
MKNLSLLFVAIAISIGASAQKMNSTDTTPKMNHEYSQKNHDGYSFNNGKLMMNKNGTNSAVTQDATLTNGTTISNNGTVTWKNGKTQTLKEGDWVDMNGKVHSNKMKSSKSWKNKSDSSMKK